VRAGPIAAPGEPAPAAAVNAVAQLASQLGVELNDVRIVSVQGEEFSDSCLGLGGIAESCLQVMTPGYVIVLEANGQQYTFHTDQTGSVIRQAPAAEGGPVATPGVKTESIIGLRQDTASGCVDIFLDLEGARYGACDGQLTATAFPTDTHRLEQLLDMQAIYASFAAETPAGMVAFNGKGPSTRACRTAHDG